MAQSTQNLFGATSLCSDFHSSLFASVHVRDLHPWPHCSYNVASCQSKSLFLTCGHNRATLWLMAKSKRDGRTTGTRLLKDDVVRMRVSTEDKKALTEAANRVGLELSAWLRQ